jgi:hypothetical protein
VSALEYPAPRIRRVEPYERTRGDEAIDVAERLGVELDDHQKQVLLDGCAVDDSGKWLHFEVGECEPRQNGKGVVQEIREITGAFVWAEPLIVHSAHEFFTSAEHFFRIRNLLEDSEFERDIKSIRSGHGEEGFILKNGSRIRFRTRTKSGGRGFSCDTLTLDEAMILPEMMVGALIPTLRARPNPQIWYGGSAVDQAVHEHGVVFARLRERAREEKTKSVCYFEWGLDFDDPDDVPEEILHSPEAWAQSNPALNIRIWPHHVLKEIESLDSRTFAVEILGVGSWPRTDGSRLSPVKPEEWAGLLDELSVLQDPICLAFDISPERRCSIAAAGYNAEGFWHVEIVAQYGGTGKLVEKLVQLTEEHDVTEVVCDGYGPSASMVKQLIEADVDVRLMTTAEHGQACGRIVDAVVQRTLRHLGDKSMTDAIKGAATRPLGDSWAWSRRNSSVDISPLVATTLALSSAIDHPDDGGDVNIW